MILHSSRCQAFFKKAALAATGTINDLIIRFIASLRLHLSTMNPSRVKSIAITLVLLFAVAQFIYQRDRPKRCSPEQCGIEIQLASLKNSPLLTSVRSKEEFFLKVDARGQMINEAGSPLWLDQLPSLLQKIESLPKARLELFIDRRCPFGSVAELLSICAHYKIKIGLHFKGGQRDSESVSDKGEDR